MLNLNKSSWNRQLNDFFQYFSNWFLPSNASVTNNLITKQTQFRYSYFQDGLKTIEHFGSYIQDLAQGLQKIRQKQDEERKQLADLRSLLKSSPVFDKEVSFTSIFWKK